MSKILVPLHVTNFSGSVGSVDSGFKKFYLKNGYFKLYDGITVSDLVLDRPLDGFTPITGVISSSDTVLIALEKLQYAITSPVPSATTIAVTADLEVGGIAVQQIIPIGTTLQTFVEDLLTKIYNPTLTAPTFSLTNNAGVREIGSTASAPNAFNLTFNFYAGNIEGATVGGIWLPGTSQGNRTGSVINYTINGITQSSNVLSVSPTFAEGGNTFTATITYGVGIQPLNSKGLPTDDLPFPAGTSALQSTTVQGIYPYFWWKSSSPITATGMQIAIENGDATKVVGASTGTITIPFAANGEYIAVAYPYSSTTKTLWYVSLFDQQAIPGGTLGIVNDTLYCNSPESYWSNIRYKIHVSPLPITMTAPNTSAQLRNL